jgi:FKBP-type peptidyl-prolyl cis-trans isomerase
VLYTSYGKLPAYAVINPDPQSAYSPIEVLTFLKKGDSAVTVEIVDTLMRRQSPALPPFAKKGDRITTSMRIVEVFKTDSVARADYAIEMEKDRPRQMKEQQEQMEKMMKESQDAQEKEDQELEKSGEIARELKEMQEYLAKRNIPAEKTGKGTFVHITEQGTGPQAEAGKYVQVKYTGKTMRTDSTFQSSVYAFQLGKGAAIRGWDEGLLLFKQGGKGTLFVPGFLAYGKNPDPTSPFRPFEALKFDIEVLAVSDEPIAQVPQQ